MASALGTLRGRIITPSTSSGSFEKRGFHVKSLNTRDSLETVGKMFMAGYACAAAAGTVAEAEHCIAQLPWQYQGFAYEGAGMGYAVRDGLPFGSSHHVADFLRDRIDGHVYMIYVGVGWAMARLPRFRWKTLDNAMPDPIFRWLALDGYGFHQAYFKTNKYVHQHYQEPEFPWPGEGPATYANRVIDQGIGRAMWFVGGAEPNRVADMIDKFPQPRHADLYAGSGLAATYAGGANEGELRTFLRRAGAYAPHVAQGSVFAAAARVETNLVTEHTGLATRVLVGVTPQQAREIFRDSRPAPKPDGDTPAFELWRQRISAGVATLQAANP
ncbi:MAG TPA: DUF1702 family protein [Actinocrinis sp.]|uniref:DUF1702 family protein n=1 Tax=Actinocrinis sp. TaxID=1920516 RepID=UPI002DDDB0A9|nr:DUF1702 family protein [Actinocrinis sp.]HEV2342715.1 DUF1702 family protein [Actinocrinis sp.]